MKRCLSCILALALLLPLSGCGECVWLPYAREMGTMALVQTVGVDGDGREWTLTVSTGARPSGVEGEEKDALILSAKGASLPAALLAVEGLGDAGIFCGYAGQLLLGEELARQDIAPVLEYLAQAVEMDLGMELWIVSGTSARQALDGAGGQGAAMRLEHLNTAAQEGQSSLTRTAAQALAALADCGSTWLPALTPGDAGEPSPLLSQGYAVVRQGKLVCFAQGQAALGLELLESRGFGRVVDLQLEDGTGVSLRLEQVQTRCEPEFAGQELTGLYVTCCVTARVIQTPRTLDGSELELLRRLLERTQGEQAAAALALAQAWDADFSNLLRMAGMAAPGQWGLLQEQWPFAFRTLDIRVETRGQVQQPRGAAG